MLKSDIVFLHPPVTFQANRKLRESWPISDGVPSTPLFEMYPYGFYTMAEYLNRRGFNTSIRNLALMYSRKDIDIHKFSKKLDVEAVAIDLHWLAHTDGSLRLSSVIKKHNPETPVIFGGLSSTYYYKDLIQYPQIDFLIRGDSAEKPLLELMRRISGGKEGFGEVPNLVWKENGRIIDNGIRWVEEDLDNILKEPDFLPQLILSKGFESLPYEGFMENPIVPVFTSRGCSFNCTTCGGTNRFYKKHCKREELAFRSPEMIVSDIKTYDKYGDFPIFLIHDIRQGGEKYWKSLLREIKKEAIDIKLIIELFKPASEDFFEEIKDLNRVSLQISPETYEEEIRARQRTHYSNASLEKNLQRGIEINVDKFDVYFMTGIAGQDRKEIQRTANYMDRLAQIGDEIHFFLSPLAPFIDPGSPAFENPDKHGFEILFKDINKYRKAIRSDSWEYCLNYKTDELDREGIVKSTYDGLFSMIDKKKKYGHINEDEYEKKKRQIEISKKINQEVKRGMESEKIIDKYLSDLDMSTQKSVSTTKELYWGDSKISLGGILSIIKSKILSKFH